MPKKILKMHEDSRLFSKSGVLGKDLTSDEAWLLGAYEHAAEWLTDNGWESLKSNLSGIWPDNKYRLNRSRL